MKKKSFESMSNSSLLSQEDKLITKLKGIDRVRDRVVSQLNDIAVIKISRENKKDRKVIINPM